MNEIETVKAAEREELPPKTGVVLTGGIDSTVTLCQVDRAPTTKYIQNIVFEDQADKKAVIDILDHEDIHITVKTFDKASTKAEKKEVLQYCYENNISPLVFGANIEEYGINSVVNDMLEWKQLSSEMNDYAVVIA